MSDNIEPHPRTQKCTGLTRIIKAGGYSVKGLRQAFKGEAAFRQECYLALATLPIMMILPLTRMDRTLIVCSTFLILIVELLNSAIEATVDRVGLEAHLLSGQAKDMGSAAVLLALLVWGYIWIEALYSMM